MKNVLLRSLCLAALITAGANVADAAEGGSGFYLLGSKGSLAGILPPEGVFFTNDSYFYSGEISDSVKFPTIGGELAVGVEADAFVNISTLLAVTPYEFLGGRLAFGLAVPYAHQDVGADVTFDLNGNKLFNDSLSDTDHAFGDPVLVGAIGWSSPLWHATLFNTVNVPIGSWSEGALANAGFNRWAYDATLATTYLDPSTGFEFSFSPGITFNGENLDTGYRTGTEFHVEFAAMQHFSEQFALGIGGYHYDQLTGDSGTAPSDFKGRVSAIGPALNWNFQLGALPVSFKAKYLHEFSTDNRTEGEAVFFQLAIPLYVPGAAGSEID